MTSNEAPHPPYELRCTISSCAAEFSEPGATMPTSPRAYLSDLLRWALEAGRQRFAREETTQAHDPDVDDVAFWAKVRADGLMTGPRYVSGPRGEDLGFDHVVANALTEAYRTGWYVAAGTARLRSPDDERTVDEVLQQVPIKFREIFTGFCASKMHFEVRTGWHVLVRLAPAGKMKPKYLPATIKRQDYAPRRLIVERVEPLARNFVSDACVSALQRHDLLAEKVLEISLRTVVVSDLTMKGLSVYRDYLLARQRAVDACRLTRRRERAEALRARGIQASENDLDHAERFGRGTNSPMLDQELEMLRAYVAMRPDMIEPD